MGEIPCKLDADDGIHEVAHSGATRHLCDPLLNVSWPEAEVVLASCVVMHCACVIWQYTCTHTHAQRNRASFSFEGNAIRLEAWYKKS